MVEFNIVTMNEFTVVKWLTKIKKMTKHYNKMVEFTVVE
jgi:hypothetical protein